MTKKKEMHEEGAQRVTSKERIQKKNKIDWAQIAEPKAVKTTKTKTKKLLREPM